MAIEVTPGRDPSHVCGVCGKPLQGGPRWCPHCLAPTSMARFVGDPLYGFHGGEPGQQGASAAPPAMPAPLTPEAEQRAGGLAEIPPGGAPVDGNPSDGPSLYEATRPVARPPMPKPEYSRWKAGATSFGPVGRVVSTTLVVLAVLWATLSFPFYLPMYLIAAGVVLVSVWRNDQVDESKTFELRNLGRFEREARAKAADRKRKAFEDAGAAEPVVEVSPPVELPPEGAYTRWEATPDTYGPATKVALTVLTLVLVAAAYPFFMSYDWEHTFSRYASLTSPLVTFIYFVLVGPAVYVFLDHLWRPALRQAFRSLPTRVDPYARGSDALVPWNQAPRPWSEFRKASGFLTVRPKPSIGRRVKVAVTILLAFVNLLLVPPRLWIVTMPAAGVFLFELWREQGTAARR